MFEEILKPKSSKILSFSGHMCSAVPFGLTLPIRKSNFAGTSFTFKKQQSLPIYNVEFHLVDGSRAS